MGRALPFTSPTNPRVLVVGLTGNIASGKSEVARILGDLGATIIDADFLAREAVRPGTPALEAIVARWGPAVRQSDGALDRGELRRRVFGDPTELAALNAIVHPEVRRMRDALVAEARARGDAVVVADIPLLFEAGLERDVDLILLVDAPEEVRLDRLRTRRGLGPEEARQMIAAQWPASRKRQRADVVIDNAGSIEELRRRVDAIWPQLAARAASR